jgi:predicted acylesterase/phospholipase RssA
MTSLAGQTESLQGRPATTFESTVTFSDGELDAPTTRERIFNSALASAAFPVLFAPVDVPGIGACVDGGAVNNTPVRLAIDDRAISRILVVTAEPLTMKPPEPLAGVNLLGHLAEILINERVYRDLQAAEKVNGYLRELDALRSEGVGAETIQRVKDVFGWRPVEIIQIRPPASLPGNAFEAFGNADLRREYIEAGRRAARDALP